MGPRGPIPNRADERRRRNTDTVGIDHAPGAQSVPIPDADPEWHPIAVRFYESLAASGQSVYYEPSDWALAVYVCEAMSKSLRAEKFPAILFQSVISAMGNLLATEGDRRRLRLELERGVKVDEDADAAVAALDDYRKRLGSG